MLLGQSRQVTVRRLRGGEGVRHISKSQTDVRRRKYAFRTRFVDSYTIGTGCHSWELTIQLRRRDRNNLSRCVRTPLSEWVQKTNFDCLHCKCVAVQTVKHVRSARARSRRLVREDWQTEQAADNSTPKRTYFPERPAPPDVRPQIPLLWSRPARFEQCVIRANWPDVVSFPPQSCRQDDLRRRRA